MHHGSFHLPEACPRNGSPQLSVPTCLQLLAVPKLKNIRHRDFIPQEQDPYCKALSRHAHLVIHLPFESWGQRFGRLKVKEASLIPQSWT